MAVRRSMLARRKAWSWGVPPTSILAHGYSSRCTRARVMVSKSSTKWRASRSPNSSISVTGASLAKA